MKPTPDTLDFIKYLIFPAIVAFLTAFFSYLATYNLNKKSNRDAFKQGRLSFIDNLLSELNKLLSVFDKLKNDVEEKGFFSIKNIDLIKPSIQKMNNLSDNAIYYEEEESRRRIVDNLSSTISLIEEIDSTERYPLNEQFKLEQIAKDTLKEIRVIKLDLLKMGLYLDENLKAQALTKSKSTKKEEEEIKAKVVNELLENLISEHSKNKDKLDQIIKENREKRSYLTMRILDIETKLRELINTLTTKRTDLLK